MTAMNYGYCRTSTKAQDLGIQREALQKAECDEIFEEQESGAKRDRPVLADVLSRLRKGDTLTIWRFDRLARSALHLLQIVEDLQSRGVRFVSIMENFDPSTSLGKAMLTMAGAFAEMERNSIEERREAGLKRARAAGKKFGRKPLSDPDSKSRKAGALALAIREVERGSSINAAAKKHGVGRATIRRHMAIDLEQVNSAIVSARKPARNGAANGHFHELAEMT